MPDSTLRRSSTRARSPEHWLGVPHQWHTELSTVGTSNVTVTKSINTSVTLSPRSSRSNGSCAKSGDWSDARGCPWHVTRTAPHRQSDQWNDHRFQPTLCSEFSVNGNVSRHLPRRGFFAVQPGVAGNPATPGYRPTRRAGGRAHRSIDTHWPAETATDVPMHRGGCTAPYGLVVPLAFRRWADKEGGEIAGLRRKR